MHSGVVHTPTDQWALVEALSEPQRRAVYDAVCDHSEAQTREEVADAVGISRSLAAFHLDKLVGAGLLEPDAQLPAARKRHKIGRPAKRYRRSAVQLDLTLPPRRYELAGRILASALAATEAGEPAEQAARRVAHEQGRQLATRARTVEAGPVTAQPLATARHSLQQLGYAPTQNAHRLTLANCPFHAIVQAAPEITCRLNLALIEGLLEGLDLDADTTATLQPRADACCVTLTCAPDQPA